MIDPDLWKLGEERFRKRGLTVRPGQYVTTRWGHTTAPPRDRAHDFMSLILDPSVHAIIAVLGGFNSNQILPYLDYGAIREHPKPIVGFSDITALVNAIYSRSRVVTFVGPVFATFCQPELPVYSENAFERLIIDKQRYIPILPSDRWADDMWHLKPGYGPREWQANAGWSVHRIGRAAGPAVGGNLPSLLVLAGTEFMPPLDGAILFLEEDESTTPALFDRGMTHLRQLGAFDRIAGLVIGRFPSATGLMADGVLQSILDTALEGTAYPVVSGIDFSHTDPMITIPLGIQTELDAGAGLLAFSTPAVE